MDELPDPIDIPGWSGSTGPFPGGYNKPHVYARDVHSGAGNCVCGSALGESKHVQAAPGVPVPDAMRTRPMTEPGHPWFRSNTVPAHPWLRS